MLRAASGLQPYYHHVICRAPWGRSWSEIWEIDQSQRTWWGRSSRASARSGAAAGVAQRGAGPGASPGVGVGFRVEEPRREQRGGAGRGEVRRGTCCALPGGSGAAQRRRGQRRGGGGPLGGAEEALQAGEGLLVRVGVRVRVRVWLG
eukprot:scaffold90109_cov39-Phaeocystis_antarctica.AAC.2